MRWDEWDASRVDDEITSLTTYAWEYTTRSVREAEARYPHWDWQVATGGAAMRIFLPMRYLTEVRGQISAGGRGMQGSDPRRIADLRKIARTEKVPVRMVFIDTRNKVPALQKVQVVWLDINEPEVHHIDDATLHKRQGWKVSEMERHEGFIPWPVEPPARKPQAQEALL